MLNEVKMQRQYAHEEKNDKISANTNSFFYQSMFQANENKAVIKEKGYDVDHLILYKYSTIFVDSDGKTYFLTPFEKIDEDALKNTCGASIIYDINFRNQFYSKDGSNITLGKMTYNKSISKEKARSTDKLTIGLWLGTCHFVIVKSKTNKYWFLHYDPWQTTGRMNRENGYQYSRPNYADLNPKLPYELESANLGENEELDILVVNVSNNYNIYAENNEANGDFDFKALKKRLGKNIISSLNIIDIKKIPGATISPVDIFDIEFEVNSDKITCKRKDDQQPVIVEVENIFNSDAYRVEQPIPIDHASLLFLQDAELGSLLASSPMLSPISSPREVNENNCPFSESLPWEPDPNWKRPF